MKKYFYLSPFLFALYAVLFLYSKNIGEYEEQVVLFPLVLSLGFAGVIFLFSKLIFKTIERASVVSSLVVFYCLFYSQLFLLIPKDISKNVFFQSNSFGFIFFILLILLGMYLTNRFQKYLLVINKVLFAIAAVLIVFPLFDIVLFEAKTHRVFTFKEIKQAAVPKKEIASENLPDVYYLIFDRYAGPRSLSSEYNVDNSKFFNFLTDKGFYLAKDATANYPKTFLSLGSSLNMEYLDFLTAQTKGGESADQSIVTPLIRYNKVAKFLVEKGYTYVHVGPNWNPTRKNDYANYMFVMEKKTYPFADAFTTGFLNTTLFNKVFSEVFKDPKDVSVNAENNEHRRWTQAQFEYLENVPKMPGPKFVFAHVLIPHDPFVFDKDCIPIPESVVDKRDHTENYMNQLQCANIKVKSLVENILKNSKNPPIIIVQSDEGPFPMKNPIAKSEPWASAENGAYAEKFPILNAYYFPDANTSGLYPSITPVNSFRVVFNTYFGTNFPLLPDKNYVFQDNQNFYKFTDITKNLQ